MVVKDLLAAFSKKPCHFAALFILLSAINQGVNGAILPVYYNSTLNWGSDAYSQFVGGPGTILEFVGAMLGGIMADRFGRRKIFFIGWGSFSVLSGVFGFLVLTMKELPFWFQSFYLAFYPFCVAVEPLACLHLQWPFHGLKHLQPCLHPIWLYPICLLSLEIS